MTQTSVNSTTLQSANLKAIGNINYDEDTFKKSGTISVAYGAGNISFSTVTDYLIFVNEVIIPLTNKVHSASLAGASYVAISPGVSSSEDAIAD